MVILVPLVLTGIFDFLRSSSQRSSWIIRSWLDWQVKVKEKDWWLSSRDTLAIAAPYKGLQRFCDKKPLIWGRNQEWSVARSIQILVVKWFTNEILLNISVSSTIFFLSLIPVVSKAKLITVLIVYSKNNTNPVETIHVLGFVLFLYIKSIRSF